VFPTTEEEAMTENGEPQPKARYMISIPTELSEEVNHFCKVGEISFSNFFEMATEYFLSGTVRDND